MAKALLALLALSMGISVDGQNQTPSQTQPQPQEQSQQAPRSLMDILMSFINPAAQSQSSESTPALANQNRQVVEPKITNDPNKPYSAILNDKGEVVAGNMVNAKCDPASTVKSMTLLTLAQLEKEGKLPQGFMKNNEALVKDMCSNSDNDAAAALAQKAGAAMGGNAQTFVAQMNRVGKDIGLNNTNFTNASGLPDQNMYSSVRDMAYLEHSLNKMFPDIAKQYAATAKSTTGAAQFADKGVEVGKTGTAKGFHGRFAQETDQTVRSFIGGLAGGGSIAIAEVSSAEWAAQIGNLATVAKGIQHADVRTNTAPLETPMRAANSNQRTV